jgi:LPS sulfotransferase NodH
MEPGAGGLATGAVDPDAPIYDLATAQADYPPWEGPPRRTLVVASHPRSGSTLLGEAIHAAGGVGLPLEYFHRGFRPRFEARWGAVSLDAYIQAVHRFRTDPAGVFGVKLFWRDLEDLAHERGPASRSDVPRPLPGDLTPSDYRELFARVEDAIPHPTFIHLRRRDRVRQAVSSLTAQRTGHWREVPGAPRRLPIEPPSYDFEQLAGQIADADRCQRHWTAFFSALGAEPYELSYERLVGDYQATVGALLMSIGATDRTARPPRLRRQSDEASEAMALRFLRDEAAWRAARSAD